MVRGECVAIIMPRDSRANSPLWNAFSLPRYTSGLPENLPAIEVGGKMNIGGLLAWEFLLMHWVEVRRWQVRAIFVMLVGGSERAQTFSWAGLASPAVTGL